jgi:putative transposase
MLRAAIEEARAVHPFAVDAWVLLPDHLHCVWTLPEGDRNFSIRWGLIKAGFSKRAKALFHREEWLNESRERHRESAIWQRRFWEHEIRDEGDFRRHLDYIHYNPVKHGLVGKAADWPYSTFHRLVGEGSYPEGWGADVEEVAGDFGE